MRDTFAQLDETVFKKDSTVFLYSLIFFKTCVNFPNYTNGTNGFVFVRDIVFFFI